MSLSLSDSQKEAVGFLNNLSPKRYKSRTGEPYIVFYTHYPDEVMKRLKLFGVTPSILKNEEAAAAIRSAWKEVRPGLTDKDIIAPPLSSWRDIFPHLEINEESTALQTTEAVYFDLMAIAVTGKDAIKLEQDGIKGKPAFRWMSKLLVGYSHGL